jgi:hypothetical protein
MSIYFLGGRGIAFDAEGVAVGPGIFRAVYRILFFFEDLHEESKNRIISISGLRYIQDNSVDNNKAAKYTAIFRLYIVGRLRKETVKTNGNQRAVTL